MKEFLKYGLAGAGGLLLLSSLIKKKKKPMAPMGVSTTVVAAPKTYTAAAGDNHFGVALRFGTTYKTLDAANSGNPQYGSGIFAAGTKVTLPSGVADTGAKTGANGTVQ